jgi:hypothetical protein
VIKNIIAPGIGFNPGGVNFIVTRGFDIGEVVAPPPSTEFRGGGGGGRYTHWTPDFEPRKFTKKDEKELKKLILQAVEEENHSALLRKAESLQNVSGALTGVRDAVNAASAEVRDMARAQEITRKKAKELLEEISEEEEILLALLRNL